MSLESSMPPAAESRARFPLTGGQYQRDAGGTVVTERERTELSRRFACEIVIIGGCGHAGLPLAVAFAERGARVVSYDISAPAIEAVNAGEMPFREPAAELPLRRVVTAGRLVASADPAVVATAEHVIVLISGLDEHASGRSDSIRAALAQCSEHFRDG